MKSITKVNDIKKLKANQIILFSVSFGYKVEYVGDVGKWTWPETAKVRWFNADYPNFEAAHWFPSIDLDSETAKNAGVLRVWEGRKPSRVEGRKVDHIKGSKIRWKIDEAALVNNEFVEQITYTNRDGKEDAVQTFYGSPQDLLKLITPIAEKSDSKGDAKK